MQRNIRGRLQLVCFGKAATNCEEELERCCKDILKEQKQMRKSQKEENEQKGVKVYSASEFDENEIICKLNSNE